MIGKKNSGKTRVITYLIEKLCGKYRILAIKHVNEPNFEIDIPGKDSWKMKKAGATTVSIVSRQKIAIISDIQNINLTEFINNIMPIADTSYDLVILEGFSRIIGRRQDVHKLVVARDKNDVEEILSKISPPVIGIITRKPFSSSYNIMTFDKLDNLATKIEAMIKEP